MRKLLARFTYWLWRACHEHTWKYNNFNADSSFDKPTRICTQTDCGKIDWWE